MKDVRTIIVRHNITTAVVAHLKILDKNNYRLIRLTEMDGPVPEHFDLTRQAYTDPRSVRADVLELLKSTKESQHQLCLVKEYVPKNRIPELRQIAMNLRTEARVKRMSRWATAMEQQL